MDGAIRSRKKRDRRDVLPDDAGAVAVLINEILRDLAGINHFAVLQRDDILRVGIAGDTVRAGEGSALTGEEVLLGKAHKPHVAREQALRRLADAVGMPERGDLALDVLDDRLVGRGVEQVPAAAEGDKLGELGQLAVNVRADADRAGQPVAVPCLLYTSPSPRD